MTGGHHVQKNHLGIQRFGGRAKGTPNKITQSIKAAFEHYHPLHGVGDRQAAEMIAEAGIDVSESVTPLVPPVVTTVPAGDDSTLPSTTAHIAIALTNQLFWDVPWNGGMFAPVRLLAPEGSVMNCTFPAATVVSGSQNVDAFAAVFAALPDGSAAAVW